MKRWLLIAVDCSIAMLLVLVMWIVNYRIPQKGMKAVAMRPAATEQNIEVDPDNIMGQQTRVILDTQDWHRKFQDKFTDTIILTETSYTSPDVSIQISYHNYDSAKLDETHGGQHKQYGTKIAYVLADVYIGDITCLQTAFA